MHISMNKALTEFHEAFGCPVGASAITWDDKAGKQLRFDLIQEEFKEVFQAFNSDDQANLLKELCDLVYVTVGTAVAFGWDFNKAFRRVHESNMSKLGPNGEVIRNTAGKVLKSPDYKPADLSDLV